MNNRRTRKRYGPVNGQGRTTFVPDWVKERNARHDRPVESYLIPSGTNCHLRKLGDKAWRPYTTTRDVTCQGFLWRNETHYGFAKDGYEIKVLVGSFTIETGD